VNKMWNPRWQPRNGRLIAKILIMIIQVNLVVKHGEGNTNSLEFSLLKLLAYHHSHFLAAILYFTSFFTMAFLGGIHLFQLGCFWIRLSPSGHCHLSSCSQNNPHFLTSGHLQSDKLLKSIS